MSLSADDLARLRRALALAAKGRFRVEPNPTVGCVLVRDGRVEGEGWHDGYGGPHAEVRALAAAGERARGATAYVSLEPCSRHGKTPPCTDALVAAGVARVVFASADPDPREADRARALLAAGGVAVEGPSLAAEGDPVIARFRRGLALDRPWTVLKWAMSLDGRIAPAPGRGARLSGPRALEAAHELRGRVDAVLVGRGTLEADDPRLTCRLEGGPPDGRRQPLRVLVTTRLDGLASRRLVSDGAAPTLVAVPRPGLAGEEQLVRAGVEIDAVGEDARGVDLAELGRRLFARGVRRLLVEGGAHIHASYLALGLADQLEVVVAPLLLCADEALPPVVGLRGDLGAPARRLQELVWRHAGGDLLLSAYLDHTP